MLYRWKYTFLLICLFPWHLYCQSGAYRFSRLDITQGLSHNQVICIFRDEKGFIWLGTMSGLNRYDGYAFKIFRHDLRDSASIIDDYVSQILEGPGHTLWVSTREGCCIYDPLIERFDRNPRHFTHREGDTASLHSDQPASFAWDGQAGWWMVHHHGIMEHIGVATGRVDQRLGLVQKLFPGVNQEAMVLLRSMRMRILIIITRRGCSQRSL